MKKLIAALTLGLGVSLVAGINPAAADEARPNGTMLVLGDSISARYNDVAGDPMQGWWSMLAARTGRTPQVAAVSGSGMVKSKLCGSADTRFNTRLGLVATPGISAIVVEGGRNDFRICHNGKPVLATRTESQLGIRLFNRDLARAARAAGIPGSRVYTMTPWGSAYTGYRDYIKGYMKRWADYYGVTYVEVGGMADEYTSDHTHPNLRGSKLLRDRMLRRSTVGSI